jgi:hypothetical protein
VAVFARIKRAMKRAARLLSIFTLTPNERRHVSGTSLIRVASVSLLLFSLLTPAAFAAGWATGMLVHLGNTGLLVSEAVFTVPMLVLCGYLVRLAYEAETDPENQ